MRSILIQLTVIVTLLLLLACDRQKTGDRDLILLPKPVSTELRNGVFRLDNSVAIHVTGKSVLYKTAELIADEVIIM